MRKDDRIEIGERKKERKQASKQASKEAGITYSLSTNN